MTTPQANPAPVVSDPPIEPFAAYGVWLYADGKRPARWMTTSFDGPALFETAETADDFILESGDPGPGRIVKVTVSVSIVQD